MKSTKTAIRVSGKPPSRFVIQDSQFIGVQFDAPAVEAVKVVAEGLLETARGLGKLAHVLNASNVNIETMLKIEDNPRPKRK